MFLLNLPDVTIEKQIPDNTTLFVAGGRKPSADWLGKLNFQSSVWAIDSGIEICDEAGIVPEMLIGDCDSANKDLWQKVSKNMATQIAEYNSDKDLTDFQLALNLYAQRRKSGGIFVTGCFGGRLDHLWSLVVSFLNPAPYKAIGLADDKEGLIFLQSGEKVTVSFETKPLAVSLLPFSKRCQGVSISGVKWELENAELEYMKPYSISNRVSEEMRVEAEIKNGQMGLYWAW